MTDAALTPTPNDCDLPRIRAEFATFNDAIDYAARSKKGLNFHDMRGKLSRVYPFSEMRDDALVMARRLMAAGIGKNDRVALIAETGPEFAALFCACVYTGAWPVPLPLPTTFGGKESFIDQLAVQLQSSDPALLLYPEEIGEMASAAATKQGCPGESWQDFAKRPAPQVDLPEAPEDLFITSSAALKHQDPPAGAFTLDDVEGVGVMPIKAEGVKCARSWKYFDPATALSGFPDLTPRDAEAVKQFDKGAA